MGDGEQRKGDDLTRVGEIHKLVRRGKVKPPPCDEKASLWKDVKESGRAVGILFVMELKVGSMCTLLKVWDD